MMDIEELLERYRQLADRYAPARANREYLDEYKKSMLALLMKDAERNGFSTAAAQEREARASGDGARARHVATATAAAEDPRRRGVDAHDAPTAVIDSVPRAPADALNARTRRVRMPLSSSGTWNAPVTSRE